MLNGKKRRAGCVKYRNVNKRNSSIAQTLLFRLTVILIRKALEILTYISSHWRNKPLKVNFVERMLIGEFAHHSQQLLGISQA